MKRQKAPVIGLELYKLLSELCDATRLHATAGNYHAAALYIVLEALRVQAEDDRTRVAVYLGHGVK